MGKIEEQIAEHAAKIAKLHSTLDKQRANKQFRCGCGAMHRIKECVAIQTHWYTSPHGCTGGDYWNEGELHIVCPVTGVDNRCYFLNYEIDWNLRTHYEYNAEQQFKRLYKKLFKEVIDEHDQNSRRQQWNNVYIDHNHAKFGLCVKGRDYKTYGKKK